MTPAASQVKASTRREDADDVGTYESWEVRSFRSACPNADLSACGHGGLRSKPLNEVNTGRRVLGHFGRDCKI